MPEGAAGAEVLRQPPVCHRQPAGPVRALAAAGAPGLSPAPLSATAPQQRDTSGQHALPVRREVAEFYQHAGEAAGKAAKASSGSDVSPGRWEMEDGS